MCRPQRIVGLSGHGSHDIGIPIVSFISADGLFTADFGVHDFRAGAAFQSSWENGILCERGKVFLPLQDVCGILCQRSKVFHTSHDVCEILCKRGILFTI